MRDEEVGAPPRLQIHIGGESKFYLLKQSIIALRRMHPFIHSLTRIL